MGRGPASRSTPDAGVPAQGVGGAPAASRVTVPAPLPMGFPIRAKNEGTSGADYHSPSPACATGPPRIPLLGGA